MAIKAPRPPFKHQYSNLISASVDLSTCFMIETLEQLTSVHPPNFNMCIKLRLFVYCDRIQHAYISKSAVICATVELQTKLLVNESVLHIEKKQGYL